MISESTIAKPIIALAFSGLVAVVESMKAFGGVVQEFGLPLIVIAGVSYALVKLYNELRDQSAARISDRDEYLQSISEHMAASMESRAELIQSSKRVAELHEKSCDQLKELVGEQLKVQVKTAHAIQSMADELHNRPCQK